MAPAIPIMREFRTTATEDGVLHLIFDMPGRSMNVFSNTAIREIEAFADWLSSSDVCGVVVRSGKASAFCAGADLGELGLAYDMIISAPPEERKRVARDHFAPIGRAFRKLETAGKPVAAAIEGLALGGGCEFALGCHYRVLADTRQTALGLPESLVGLFPGGGGTQRLPRLVGLERSLPILLEGARLAPAEALAAGAAHQVVALGEAVAAAECWVRSNPQPMQPWDRSDWRHPTSADISVRLSPLRDRILTNTGRHYPAPLAILDCLERGFAAPMDKALAIEIDIFSDLIRRPEPRNMIQTLFLAKQDYDKRRKAGELPAFLDNIVSCADRALADEVARHSVGDVVQALRFAGFTKPPTGVNADLVQTSIHTPQTSGVLSGEGMWFEAPQTPTELVAAKLLAAVANGVNAVAASFSDSDRRLADYIVVRDLGFPAYAGGPFAVLKQLGDARLRHILNA
jgi:3-hydroxyacyl-CoA dehydrogenase / enoyl-CoA hydratase / 3-hydroxybutyryl-CoA epimerase